MALAVDSSDFSLLDTFKYFRRSDRRSWGILAHYNGIIVALSNSKIVHQENGT